MSEKVKNLTSEQIDEIVEGAGEMAKGAVYSNALAVMNGLLRQMQDDPEKNEVTLKISVNFRCEFGNKWSLDCCSEWERKVKRKDNFGSREFDFEQPDLPGIAKDTVVSLAGAMVGLNKAKLQMIEERPLTKQILSEMEAKPEVEKDHPCLCGHEKGNHDNGGNCAECVCELYEPINSDPYAKKKCTCGHEKGNHTSFSGVCLAFACQCAKYKEAK